MLYEISAANISYPSSAAALVFGVYLSARAAFGLTGNRPQSAPACSFLRYAQFNTMSYYDNFYNEILALRKY